MEGLAAPLAAPMPAAMPPVEVPGDDPVEQSSFTMGILVLLMVLWSSVGHQIAARTKYIGDASTACAMGLITGLAVLVMQRYISADAVHQLLTFNPADFFTYLLPPIIFYAGLSVKKKQFFRNFSSITLFGVLGTYVAFAVIASTLFVVSKLPGNSLETLDSLALGVIFAATDSVAVIQVLQQERTPLLYSLVFGEGVLNDATSVALLRAVQAMGRSGDSSYSTWTSISWKFMSLFALSLILGSAFGLGASFMMRTLTFNSTPQEVALLGMLGYLSYLCGEWTGLSGIVTLFCCAVIISHYGLHNVSPVSRVTMVRSFETLSYLSEGAIFIYVGMDTLDPLKWANTYFAETLWLFVVLTMLTMLGRAAFVFPLSFLHNMWSREKLTGGEMIVIWWAGLMRGAVSVALVYYYFDPKGQSDNSHHATLIAATLVVVLFSVMVFGALTKPLLDFMLRPGETTGTLNAILAGFVGQGHGGTGGNTWGGGASSTRGTESELDLMVDSPRRPPMQRYVSHDTLLALEAEGESDTDLKRALSGVLEGDGMSRPSSAKEGSRGQNLVASSRSDLVTGNGVLPSVGYPGSVAVPRQLQGSGNVPRTRAGPLPGPLPPGGLQPLGIEGIRDPLGRSGVGHRLREVSVVEPFASETPEPSPRGTLERQHSYTSKLGRMWTTFDERYLQPVFGGPNAGEGGLQRHRSYEQIGEQDDGEGLRLL